MRRGELRLGLRIWSQNKTELRAFFCRNYSPCHSFSLPFTIFISLSFFFYPFHSFPLPFILFFSLSHFFSPFKKKRHRIKIEMVVMARKKFTEFRLIIMFFSFYHQLLETKSISERSRI